MAMVEYQKVFDLEQYLFGEVAERFKLNRTISAFDFFCIVIWKANRAKSKIARRLLHHGKGYSTIEQAVANLIREINDAADSKEKLRVVWHRWGFRLPMASAILTVLNPDDFTVYDVRVCQVLDQFQSTQHRSRFDDLWDDYSKYVSAVRNMATERGMTLREQDKWLWGKSFHDQLEADIACNFNQNAGNDNEIS